ncbi:MAG: dihydroorotase [Gammaproteobacteria bacterium]
MSAIHIRGGRVIDPANGVDAIRDVYVAGGRIAAVGRKPAGFRPARTIDARGRVVVPGLVDLSARTREPKASIGSETAAAAAGGITTLCTAPDTRPIIDTPAVAELIHQRAAAANLARVVCLGALTRNLAGEQITDMHALKSIGCVGVSNALAPVTNTDVLRRALEYAATCDLTVFLSPEDHWLGRSGRMHEGAVSTRLGIPAIPETAETVALARDLLLVEATGARVHFCRLSTARGVRMLSDARRRGLPVSADVAIHNLHLTDADVGEFDPMCHVRPPLRTRRDRDALRAGVARGGVAAICSDHQPRDLDGKSAPFAQTAPGISGLDTLLPLTLALVDAGVFDLPAAIAALTIEPARILGLPVGHLSAGAPADVAIFDPKRRWTLTEEGMRSAGKNSPFIGRDLRGRVTHTLFEGRVVFARANADA